MPQKCLPTTTTNTVAVLDERDPNAANTCHEFGIQFGGPKDVCFITFQHGARTAPGSTPGVYDDDLLAIIEERFEGFQSGAFSSPENADVLEHIKAARAALSLRFARRIAQGKLGVNEQHKS